MKKISRKHLLWCLFTFSLLLVSNIVCASEISWDWEEWSELTDGTICEGKIEIAREIYDNRKSIEEKRLFDMLMDDCYLIQDISLQAVGERKDKKSLSILHKLLLYNSKKGEEFIVDGRNAMILWALTKIGCDSSVNVIISFLIKEEKRNKNDDMIEKALYTLGFFETEESINFLSDYAIDKNKFSFGRLIALEMLDSMRNQLALELLKEAQSSGDEFVRNIVKHLIQNKKNNDNIIWEKDMTDLLLY